MSAYLSVLSLLIYPPPPPEELRSQSHTLEGLVSDLSTTITDSLVTAAAAPLRQVADTPRLYRRTNRAPPSTHQPYIATAASVLTTFAEECRGQVDEGLVVHWLTRAAGQVSQRCVCLYVCVCVLEREA